MLDWLRSLPNARREGRDARLARMTFGNTSLGHTISRTSLFLKRQLWIWPIVAVVVLAIVGYVVSAAIRHTMQATLSSQLSTLVNVERSMLERWFHVQESNASDLANRLQVRETVQELIENWAATAPAASDQSPSPNASTAEIQLRLAKLLEPSMASHEFAGFFVSDKRQRVIAASNAELIGKTHLEYESFLGRALNGRPNVSAPFSSVAMVADESGRLRTGTPTMFVCVPVRDANFQIVAALALRIRPEREFTDILQMGRIGKTGETYAINKRGVMVSNSRFDDNLILLGLLPDQEHAASILNIQVRDPGGPMVDGFRPTRRRHELPLTQIAASAVNGATGVNMVGYRDYRGSPSVGAWTWLADYDLGLITEIDIAEAYRPLTILRWWFFSLFALLIASAIAIFAFTIVVSRLRRQAQKAAIEAKQLGQYRLIDKIGAGAMGVVYKGQHAMLRRPTAIKMLDVDRVNESSIERFEREVQITCNLNNPHTVAIYDYGRTPEGVFYYAMEYLDGIDLQTLVDRYGPQPEGRVALILRQICASLYEAHSLGLVHRDIKPANIMLNRRGAEPDVVKVLDFGLVKALHDEKEGRAQTDASGTPLYMPPEAIQTPELVDARSDLYAVGAVGYFLITGQTAFAAQTLSELCQQHITAIPDAPSRRLGRPVSSELEHAILACLEKSRAKRPQTARDLAAMLARVTAVWSLDDAETWWSRHERGLHSTIQTGSDSIAARDGGASSGLASQSSQSQSAASPGSATSSAGLDQTTFLEPPK